MATFKVGQRVRVIDVAAHHNRKLIGKEGTIVSIPGPLLGDVCAVHVDGERQAEGADSFRYFVPLTDPKADAFIEQIKRLKPEPESVPLPARVKA